MLDPNPFHFSRVIATKVQAACLQTPVGGTIDTNLAATDEMLRHAAQRGVKIVCLPEYFSFPIFSPDTATPAMIHEIRKQTLMFLQRSSGEYDLMIVGNVLAIKDNGVFNTAYVYDRGELLELRQVFSGADYSIRVSRDQELSKLTPQFVPWQGDGSWVD